MNCEHYDDVLNDYVDGATADGRADAVQAFTGHLASCERCQALVRDFSLIRQTARSLPTELPPAGAWSRLEARLGDAPNSRSRAWVPLAVAAALALLVVQVGGPRDQATPAVAELALPSDEANTWLDERHYTSAIDRLEALGATTVDTGTDPSATATIRAGLDTLDRAIADAREALAHDPESVVAQEGLVDALDTKVALLQDSVGFMEDTTP